MIVSDIVDDTFGNGERAVNESALHVFQVVASDGCRCMMELVITNQRGTHIDTESDKFSSKKNSKKINLFRQFV